MASPRSTQSVLRGLANANFLVEIEAIASHVTFLFNGNRLDAERDCDDCSHFRSLTWSGRKDESSESQPLRADLEGIDGFISVDDSRASPTEEYCWYETAVKKWRNHSSHRESKNRGRVWCLRRLRQVSQ